MMSVIEFRSSNLVLNAYETTFEMSDNALIEVNKKTALIKKSALAEGLNRLSLIPKYNLMGSSNLNSYKLLKKNEELMEKQRSQIFINSASLYNKNTTKNLNKSANDVESHNITLKIFDNISQKFEEEFYLFGVCLGRMEGNITIKNIPLIRQILCGVHTEKGLDLNSAYLGIINVHVNQNQDSMPADLRKLIENSKNLILKFTETSLSNNRQINEEITNLLDKIVDNLKITSKESVLFYNYINQNDILEGQQVIIDLGVKILSIIDSLNVDHRTKAFMVLTLILERGEIELEMMSKIIDEKRDKYPEICFNLMSFHCRLLEFLLIKFGRRTTDDITKNFIEKSLALAYYRVPYVLEILIY